MSEILVAFKIRRLLSKLPENTDLTYCLEYLKKNISERKTITCDYAVENFMATLQDILSNKGWILKYDIKLKRIPPKGPPDRKNKILRSSY